MRVSFCFPSFLSFFFCVSFFPFVDANKFQTDRSTLRNCLQQIENSYFNHPYHNRLHGAQVRTLLFFIT